MNRHPVWRPITKFMIGGADKFLGPGSRELLGHIRATGSVRRACAAMGLSYSKAWHILSAMEREAGFPVVARRKGGAGGGGEARLTCEGERLLQRYDAYERDCRRAVERLFRAHFPREVEGT